jgi:hypothetical protein
MILNPYRFAAAAAAFPEVADADTQSGQMTGSVVTVTWPTNIEAGDLILVAQSIPGWPGYVSNTGGCTLLLERESAGENRSISVLGIVAAGTESGTFTITNGVSTDVVWRAVRIPAATWYGGTLSAGTTTNASDGLSGDLAAAGLDPPSRSPAWGAANTLWIAMVFPKSTVSYTFTGYPADYSDTSAQVHSLHPFPGLATARRELNAASENPGAFATSGHNSGSYAATVAIRPAA